MADRVTWTSAISQVQHQEQAVVVEVKEDILTEIRATVDEMVAANTVTLKSLRCLAGQAACVASLLHVRRPSVSMLWAPLYDIRGRCPSDAGRVRICAWIFPYIGPGPS